MFSIHAIKEMQIKTILRIPSHCREWLSSSKQCVDEDAGKNKLLYIAGVKVN
jgi:hypothetical protein